ncbi:hypothetical protein [Actinomadura sp. KC06]|nr:hypothetical protein [Actinomadura sp. KC06]
MALGDRGAAVEPDAVERGNTVLAGGAICAGHKAFRVATWANIAN